MYTLVWTVTYRQPADIAWKESKKKESKKKIKEASVYVFISLIRMRSKRGIKMGRLCTPGGAVLGIVGEGVTFRFLNGEAILDENMLFWVRLYALVVVLKILLDFRL